MEVGSGTTNTQTYIRATTPPCDPHLTPLPKDSSKRSRKESRSTSHPVTHNQQAPTVLQSANLTSTPAISSSQASSRHSSSPIPSPKELRIMTYNVGGPSISSERFSSILSHLMAITPHTPQLIGLQEWKPTEPESKYHWITAHATNGQYHLISSTGNVLNGVACLVHVDLAPSG